MAITAAIDAILEQIGAIPVWGNATTGKTGIDIYFIGAIPKSEHSSPETMFFPGVAQVRELSLTLH